MGSKWRTPTTTRCPAGMLRSICSTQWDRLSWSSSIKGFKIRKRAKILIVRGLVDDEVCICINTLVEQGCIPVSFSFPQDDTEEKPSPSHSENKAAKTVSSTKKGKDTSSIFNVGNSNEDSYKILREHLLNLYEPSVFRDKLGPNDRSICKDQRLTFNNAKVEPVNYCTPLDCSQQLQEASDIHITEI